MSSSDFGDAYRFKIKQTAASLDDSIAALSHEISDVNEKLHHSLKCNGFPNSSQMSKKPLYPCLNNPSNNLHSSCDVMSHLLSLRRRMDQLSSRCLTIRTTPENDYIQLKEDQEKIKALACKIAALQNIPPTPNSMSSHQLVKSTPSQNSTISNSMTMLMPPSTYKVPSRAPSVDDDFHIPIPAPTPTPNQYTTEGKEHRKPFPTHRSLSALEVSNLDAAAVWSLQGRIETKGRVAGSAREEVGIEAQREWEIVKGKNDILVNEDRRNESTKSLPQEPSVRTTLKGTENLSTLKNLGLSGETTELLGNEDANNEKNKSLFEETLSRKNMMSWQSRELTPVSCSGATETLMNGVGEDLSSLDNLGLSDETMQLLGYKRR